MSFSTNTKKPQMLMIVDSDDDTDQLLLSTARRVPRPPQLLSVESNAVGRRNSRAPKRTRDDPAAEGRMAESPSSPPPAKKTRASPRTSPAARGASPSPGKTASIKVGIPGVLLAQKADWPPTGKVNYKGWWMSEKLDGVRAYWDGEYLCSRNGNTFNAPDWFTASLPKDGTTLDGELFMGRKKFQSAVSVVKGQASNPLWGQMRYVIFDVPSLGKEPFESRIEKLKAMPCLAGTGASATRTSSVLPDEWFTGDSAPGALPTYARIVPQVLVNSMEHLTSEFDAVAALGGEGIMIRQPKSIYFHKRSATLLKLKSFQDTEGKIIGHDAGTGRLEGLLGAYVCVLRDGKQFKCGTGMDDAHRRKRLPIGTIITVRFQEMTDGGIPRFPVFIGPRYDIDFTSTG